MNHQNKVISHAKRTPQPHAPVTSFTLTMTSVEQVMPLLAPPFPPPPLPLHVPGRVHTSPHPVTAPPLRPNSSGTPRHWTAQRTVTWNVSPQGHRCLPRPHSSIRSLSRPCQLDSLTLRAAPPLWAGCPWRRRMVGIFWSMVLLSSHGLY